MLGVLILLALVYDFHHIVFLKPVGIHQWRSSISAAFPLNLSQGGSFFATQTNALLADNFQSDVSVVEFPLIYLIVSIFYRIFGVHEFWFRSFQVLLGFMGLLYLFRAAHFFTRDWFYAAFIPLIFFTSPVYAYYISGFIPDAVALSLTFGGFWYFLKYSENRKTGTWIWSMVFFALAGLSKTSSLLPYLGIGAASLLELWRRYRGKEASRLFAFQGKTIFAFLGVLILVFAWYLYARLHINSHGGTVSGVEIRPIWNMDRETIGATLEQMNYWFERGVYHANWFIYLTLAVFLFNLAFPRKADGFLYRLSILTVFGALAFTMLFFFDMRNHDYYQLNNFFIYIPIYLCFFTVLKELAPRIYGSWWSRGILLVLVVFMAINCADTTRFRYSERDLYYVSSKKNLEMYDLGDALEELDVPADSRVHCTPDRSINISLYLCRRKGLTDYGPMRNMNMEERLAFCREIGIEYLILGSGEQFEGEDLDGLLGTPLVLHGKTKIYKIPEE